MNNITTEEKILPWYKQGWPWALIAIPFLTVVAGVITFIIANDTTDSLVKDDYYKHGLSINKDLSRTHKAVELEIIAKLKIDIDANLFFAELVSINAKKPSELIVNFSHPTQRSKDKTLVLTLLSGNEYAGSIDGLADAYWHILIEDAKQEWLIKTRWLYPQEKELLLEPAAH